MMLKFAIFAAVLCLYYVSNVEAISGSTIADKADSYEHSTKWSYASRRYPGRNTNKCNIFIWEIMKEVGGNVPHRRWYIRSPIGAGEWGSRTSTYLTKDKCWTNVSRPRVGDVMGDGVHVAFYTGYRTTTSAAHSEVVINDWGFRSGSGPGTTSRSYTYWRYVC